MKDKWPLTVLLMFLGLGILIGLFLNSRNEVDFPPVVHAVQQDSGGRMTGSQTQPFSRIAKEVTPTVVTITSEKTASLGGGLDELFRKFHKDIPETGLGSGVIVGHEGYILTNNHVVSDARKIRVKLSDKRVLEARFLGADPLTDIALIKVEADDLPVVRFGNSDEVEVGDWVLAVGSPLSLNSTVTAGIVSAIGRQIDIIGDQYGVEHFIQTDAVINPGNSGGALVNVRGELIGINTAIATKTGLYQGYGFAVPVNLARHVMEDILTYGEVIRGYIGVAIKEVDATYARAVGLTQATGVLVESLTDNGAARDAGIHEGDVILRIDDQELDQPGDLQAYVALKKPGDRVRLLLYQDGRKTEKTVTLRSKDGSTEVPKPKSNAYVPDSQEEEMGHGMGFEVQDLSEAYGKNADYNYGKGVLVTAVSEQARERNIFEGFIVTRVNNKTVNSYDDYMSEVKKLRNGDAVVLHLRSTGSDRLTIVTAVEVRKK